MKMKKKQPPKGPGGTPKPDRKKKKVEQIEVINITLSVELLAGWMKADLVKHLTGELERVAECLGGDNGPRFIVRDERNTIVEMPDWKTVDIEPIK